MNCPKCNNENLSAANYCTECGTALFKVCDKCGAKTSLNSKFCPGCGYQYPALDLRVEYYKRKMDFYDEILIGKCKDGKFVLVKDRQIYKFLSVDSLKPTIPYEFEDIGRFEELDWCNSIIAKKDGLWGLINPLSGQIICDFKYEDYDLVYLQGSYDVNGTVLLKENGKWGKVDVEYGQVLLPFIYDEIYGSDLDFSGYNEFDLLKYNGYWGVVADGKQLIPFEYIKLGYRVYDRWGYISPQYGLNDDSIPPSQHKNGKWGIINIYNGEIILKPEYDEIKSFGNKIYKIRKDGKWGVVDIYESKILLKCEYDEIEDFERGTYKLKKNGKWGLVNYNGTIILACEFDDVFYEIVTHGFAFTMRIGDRWGKIIYDLLYASYGPSTKYDCIYSEDEIKIMR